MSMSDCLKCWDTPCRCGWDYKDYTAEQLSNHIAAITQYRSKEEAKAIIDRAAMRVDGMEDWHDKPSEKKSHVNTVVTEPGTPRS